MSEKEVDEVKDGDGKVLRDRLERKRMWEKERGSRIEKGWRRRGR